MLVLRHGRPNVTTDSSICVLTSSANILEWVLTNFWRLHCICACIIYIVAQPPAQTDCLRFRAFLLIRPPKFRHGSTSTSYSVHSQFCAVLQFCYGCPTRPSMHVSWHKKRRLLRWNVFERLRQGRRTRSWKRSKSTRHSWTSGLGLLCSQLCSVSVPVGKCSGNRDWQWCYDSEYSKWWPSKLYVLKFFSNMRSNTMILQLVTRLLR